jgi:Polyketide cyclase / dehydrase and lipid transport
MDIHFNHTELVDAPAETLFQVITDYADYARFNPAVVKMTVVAKDKNGAEFLAKCKTRIAKQVRAFDRYERHGDHHHQADVRAQISGSIDVDHPLCRHRPLHPHHRRVDYHATRARPRDEAPPSAVVLRHQLQSIHPRGAAPRKRDKKSDRLMPASLVRDSQTCGRGRGPHVPGAGAGLAGAASRGRRGAGRATEANGGGPPGVMTCMGWETRTLAPLLQDGLVMARSVA